MNQISYPLNVAWASANYLLHAIQPACKRVEVAGSIRRRCDKVHDIDLVAWPIYDRTPVIDLFGNEVSVEYTPAKIVHNLVWLPEIKPESIDYKKSDPRIIKGEIATIPFQIYLVEPSGNNWGAMLQLRTGSERFNINLATGAKVKGLHYKAGYGIFNRDDCRIDDDTEERIISLCGATFVEPEKRG